MSIKRIMGLDIGSKRIGVALSDPLMIISQPLRTILRRPEKDSLAEISSICSEYNVQKIIVGLPKNMNNTIGPQAEDCQKFAELIHEKTGLEILFEDERLTSKQAEMFLAQQGRKYTKDKGLVDVASAAIILQQYMDKRRTQ